MDGWNTTFLLGWPIFMCYVSLVLGRVSDDQVPCNPHKSFQYLANLRIHQVAKKPSHLPIKNPLVVFFTHPCLNEYFWHPAVFHPT